MKWYRVDLHVHTPVSACYVEPEVTYVDILRKALERGLDIIAFTDHNTVGGYAGLLSEVRDLEFLEALDRLQPHERERLEEYRQLMRRILVLPGFEFTATFGFHILGIFSEETSIRDLEHVLLSLGVPSYKLDEGTGEVGATADVLTAYRMIRDAGGIAIAAHANSSHGVVLQGLGFGGQTRIAFTQDENLHALEVTDLESTRPQRTANFFNGSRPEYPRRMHCIQGSDAHRLDDNPSDQSQFGVGGRAMEILLPERSFAALKEAFESTDFSRMRPYRPSKRPGDRLQAARREGASVTQSFHQSMSKRGGRMHAILRDVVAFANTNGGTIYVGVSGKASAPIKGVERPDQAMETLAEQIRKRTSPQIDVTIEPMRIGSKTILRVSVPQGYDKPYALEGSKIYVRQGQQTKLAGRDEMVEIVKEAPDRVSKNGYQADEKEDRRESKFRVPPPRTGVEVVDTVEREGVLYHAMRDLRTGSVVRNVSKESARRLWRYAIDEHEKNSKSNSIHWEGQLGISGSYRSGGAKRYNLAQLDEQGTKHFYYGVTEGGLHGEWKSLVKSHTSSSRKSGSSGSESV